LIAAESAEQIAEGLKEERILMVRETHHPQHTVHRGMEVVAAELFLAKQVLKIPMEAAHPVFAWLLALTEGKDQLAVAAFRHGIFDEPLLILLTAEVGVGIDREGSIDVR
jgi:hypothetical protein